MNLDSTAPSVGTTPPRARFRTTLPQQPLNGAWRFRYSERASAAPAGWAEEEVDDADWDVITVPSSWPLPGPGRKAYGRPAYTNVQFPFPVDPPHPPDANPVGDHRLTFTAGPEFAGGARLRFDGVDNTAEVWLNGVCLGQTRGSRLVQEFDVGAVLRTGTNVLAVRVAQFSASSYLEDQDMWWLPGIFRDVTLLAQPAGSVTDLFVHADWAEGRGRLLVEVQGAAEADVRITELGVSAPAGTAVDVGPVTGWTADTPRTYELTVTTPVETITERVGFRTVTWSDGVLAVNGTPILIKGVNRHEFDPDLGRVVPADRLRSELALMKRHNVNAIRTSHYPPHPDLLDLADEWGFWVIDEADLETHGFFFVDWRRNPSDEPAWGPAYLDRMRRTVERDKNRPCVIGWSLGNESHTGVNLAATSAWTRQRDPSRFVHYEGDWDSGYVDVYSRMYASQDEVAAIGAGTEEPTSDPALDAHRRGIPFLQCEYAHAMGNGPGGMSEYQDLFARYPRLAGGFVWEWLEHGIHAGHEGEPYFAYGGDFGEVVHDGNFVCDGLVDADRRPRPGLIDFAAVVRPLTMIISADWSEVAVTNGYDHGRADHLSVVFRLDGPAGVLADGVVGRLNCSPGQTQRLALPDLPGTDGVAPGPQVLTVSAVVSADLGWSEGGEELAWTQATRGSDRPAPVTAVVVPVAVAGGAPGWRLGPAAYDADGRLSRLGDLAVGGPTVGLWRAPTDNDLGRDIVHDHSDAADWAGQGLDRLVTRVVEVVAEDTALVVRHRVAAAVRDAAVDVTYRWTSDGDAVAVAVEVAVGEHWGESWARLGLDFGLDDGWDAVTWGGYGPGQSYPDTGQGQRLGWHPATVDDLQVDYVRPQDNGSRVVTGSLHLRRGGRTALTVEAADAPFAFTLRPWSVADLAAARHTYDLVPDGSLHLQLDHIRHGVGTAACGPGVLPAYRLRPADLVGTPVRFGFVFRLG